MQKKIEFDDDTRHLYYNSDNQLSLRLLFNNHNLEQLQIHLYDANPEIKNKKLIVKPLDKINTITTSHEKHFKKENKYIIEYYYDNIFDHHAEIEKYNNFKKTECFGRTGKLFSREIIEYNSAGKAIKEKQYIKNIDGSILEYEREIGTE